MFLSSYFSQVMTKLWYLSPLWHLFCQYSCHQNPLGWKIWRVCIWMGIMLFVYVNGRYWCWGKISFLPLSSTNNKRKMLHHCDAIRICVYGLLDIWLSTTTSPSVLLSQIPQQPQQPLLIALVLSEYQYMSQIGLRTKTMFYHKQFCFATACSIPNFILCNFSTW